MTLSGYVKGREEVKRVNEKDYLIQYYQGDHLNEYSIVETKEGKLDGKAQLFNNGVIRMSWMFENGIRKGNVTTYNKGVVEAIRSWDNLIDIDSDDYCIENRKCGKLMVIRDYETDQIVYEGSYDDKMQRNGYGFVFDTETGKRKSYGYFDNDEMIQLICEFDDDQMTQYEVKDKESNLDPYEHRPVYIGGFLFIEDEHRVVRHGNGVEINYVSGMAEYAGVWMNGTKMNNIPLYNGWFNKTESEESLKLIVDQELSSFNESRMTDERLPIAGTNEEELARQQVLVDEQGIGANELIDLVVQSPVDIQSLSSTVCKLIVKDSKCTIGIDTLKIWYKPFLKEIEIGNDCFKEVTKVIIKGNNRLGSIVIGNNCFTSSSKGSLFIAENPLVMTISIGKKSFEKFGSFNLHSKECFTFSNRSS